MATRKKCNNSCDRISEKKMHANWTTFYAVIFWKRHRKMSWQFQSAMLFSIVEFTTTFWLLSPHGVTYMQSFLSRLLSPSNHFSLIFSISHWGSSIVDPFYIFRCVNATYFDVVSFDRFWFFLDLIYFNKWSRFDDEKKKKK